MGNGSADGAGGQPPAGPAEPHGPDGPDGEDQGGLLTIDCERCIGLGTSACADCVVTFLCGHEADEAVVVDVGEARALRLLAGAGLVPALRHRRRTG